MSLSLALLAAALGQPNLAGMWVAEREYAPPAPHAPIVVQYDGRWTSRVVRLPEGELRVRFSGGGLSGQWLQPGNAENPHRIATPVVFKALGANRWAGIPQPLRDVQHLTLYVRPMDGALQAYVRNPERNAGARIGVRTVALDGATIRLQKPGRPDIVGRWSPERDALSFDDLGLPGPFVFTRRIVSSNPSYHYHRPSDGSDGWRTGTLDDAGIDEQAATSLVDRIQASPTELDAPYLQSLLVARHGKLVLEEYFNGFDAARPHDVRSAGKSVATMLVGRAIEDARDFSPDSPVGAILTQYAPFANNDARKGKITVGDLMSMSAGYACDDNDDDSPGGEDRMQGQTAQPDWYKFTLDLPMLFTPGSQARYCSAQINLLGAIVERKTRAWLPDYFFDRFARPLQFGPYGMWLMPPPAETAYMAGGDQFRPRDFLKFGQLFLDGGRWNGRRVIEPAWLKQVVAKHSYIKDAGGDYGYGWHLVNFPSNGRTVSGYNAGGNGGQLLYVFPELDMSVMITAANYGQYRVWSSFGQTIIADGLLAAVRR